MSSQYIVVQFGNVMTGEYLNIGVLTYDLAHDESIHYRFISNWKRIRQAFGEDKISEEILNSIVRHISGMKSKQELLDYINKSNSPYSSLQFTAPRASLESSGNLIEQVAKTFIVE